MCLDHQAGWACRRVGAQRRGGSAGAVLSTAGGDGRLGIAPALAEWYADSVLADQLCLGVAVSEARRVLRGGLLRPVTPFMTAAVSACAAVGMQEGAYWTSDAPYPCDMRNSACKKFFPENCMELVSFVLDYQ